VSGADQAPEGGARALPEDDPTAYFRAVEEAFVRLRGAPLLLSPADFRVAAGWHRDGVPLPLVLASLEEVFARRRERGAKGRINSLSYCAPAVDAAWQELRELQGPTHGESPPEVPVAERLAALAEALPETLDDRPTWVTRLTAVGRASAAGSGEVVEERLRELDLELLAAAEASLDTQGREEVEAEVAAIIDGLRDRFADAELAALHGQLFRQRLRRRLGLPVLTLFG
jgi:hypothetical protein